MKSGMHTHDIPMLVLRIALGIIFIAHGWQKLANIEQATTFFTSQFGSLGPILAYVVGYTELIGGLMILVGLYASYAAIALSVVMAVALFWVKGDAVFRTFNVPAFEIDLILLASLFVIALKGSGSMAVKPSGCACCGEAGDCGPTTTPRKEAAVVYPNEGR